MIVLLEYRTPVNIYCVPADGQCYEYKWMASAWKGSSRTVWCQRSDGVNVTGKPISLCSLRVFLN